MEMGKKKMECEGVSEGYSFVYCKTVLNNEE